MMMVLFIDLFLLIIILSCSIAVKQILFCGKKGICNFLNDIKVLFFLCSIEPKIRQAEFLPNRCLPNLFVGRV